MMIRVSVKFCAACLLLVGCSGDAAPAEGPDTGSKGTDTSQGEKAGAKGNEGKQVQTEPPLQQPVPLWEGGKLVRQVEGATALAEGYLIMDLGEAFTPYLFTEGTDAQGQPLTNAYRETYLALARGEFPDDYHGERARDDKYLELYGIVPTLAVLRDRAKKVSSLACAEELDLQPLIDFQSTITYKSNPTAKRFVREFQQAKAETERLMRSQRVATPDELNLAKLSKREQDSVRRYQQREPQHAAIRAVQMRLECEGFYKGRGKYLKGGLDWVTHEALAEFERRHRVYSWGYIGRDSLAVLRLSPMEAERLAVLRVLTERAMHAAGALEDGSTSTLSDDTPRTFKGADGQQHPIPNLEADLQARVIAAFGLQTPESMLKFLESLGELAKDEHRYVAIRSPDLPEYYSSNMDLTLVYDRGDVWYDFPFDTDGRPIPQPVGRRPRVTVFTRYNGQRIPLARFGTTIGGWRSEKVVVQEPVEGEEDSGVDAIMWRYKDSPVGDRVWEQIVAAPVWLPPDSTPDRAMLTRRSRRKKGEPRFQVNYHETGPSYASAYGLVAAYHRKYVERPDGTILIGNDEGIRTHGSVDYMSIMRRHSHGCHRLHNHIAVRLMSFVLKHRPHKRIGQQPVSYVRELEWEDEEYRMEIRQGGYVFQLEQPLKITVLEGRIRGKHKAPFDIAVPKYDEAVGAYMTADGRAVELQGNELIEVPTPLPDGGVRELFEDALLTDAVREDTGKVLPSGGSGSGAAPGAFPRYQPARRAVGQ